MTTTITLLSLQCFINSSLYQKLQLSTLVRYRHEEETAAFAHKTSLRVTRSGGPKVLKASPSNRCTIPSPLLIGNTSTKSSQGCAMPSHHSRWSQLWGVLLDTC